MGDAINSLLLCDKLLHDNFVKECYRITKTVYIFCEDMIDIPLLI